MNRCEYCGAHPGHGGLGLDRCGKLACLDQRWCEAIIHLARHPPSLWRRLWKKATDPISAFLASL